MLHILGETLFRTWLGEIDLKMCLVVYELRAGQTIVLISLAEMIRGLSCTKSEGFLFESSPIGFFFESSPILLQIWLCEHLVPLACGATRRPTLSFQHRESLSTFLALNADQWRAWLNSLEPEAIIWKTK